MRFGLPPTQILKESPSQMNAAIGWRDAGEVLAEPMKVMARIILSALKPSDHVGRLERQEFEVIA